MVIGHVNEEKKGKVYVFRVWCKICAKHKARINGQLRGKAKKHASAFIEGTTSVTKYHVSYLPHYGTWQPTIFLNWTSLKRDRNLESNNKCFPSVTKGRVWANISADVKNL